MREWESELWVLSREEGQALLRTVAEVTAPGPADLERWRRGAPAEVVSAAVRLVSARRRGIAKFARAESMWLDAKGLEQATAEPVARHKARRLKDELVVDLCCGIGGDAIALASRADVLCVDTDEGMCHRALWNTAVYGVADRVAAVRARAERFRPPERALIHIDPDRRARSATRAKHLIDYIPNLPFLASVARSARGGAIKLGPASDFQDHFDAPDLEIELISLHGECKEATVWFGDRATCRRRATVLPQDATWTDRDAPLASPAPPGEVDGWILDPDPALVRAGLLDGFAAAHGLRRCAWGVDYLTGPEPVASPFLAAFEVVAYFPLDLKTLRRAVAERRLGPLEIKSKGVKFQPERLRAALRPAGPNPATLLLVGGRGAARAVLAHRYDHALGSAP